MASRPPSEHFPKRANAVLARRRVHLVYASRARGDQTERVVSPQRLVHYRDNWYLDAYCHLRERLPTFSIDAMVRVKTLKEAAERSLWVSAETWHPDQVGQWVGQQWQISFPYSDTRELVMDIMRHGADVHVVAPESLGALVINKHREAALVNN